MLNTDSLVVYMAITAVGFMVTIIGYYLKETLSTIKVVDHGQSEIKSSLARIETDLFNMKDNYSVLVKKTDAITNTMNEQGIKIAKLEEKVNSNKVA